ncbi:DUF1330 domain-containing protein [Streptomyces sp. NPDC093801]|uniref:DUF1330 domain-containing protein n=1 Tax=Streptomyces sp. NPDC093801 TaxID=3155203 RepID=UPI00344B34F6
MAWLCPTGVRRSDEEKSVHYVLFIRTDHTPDAALGHYLAHVGPTLDAFDGRLLAFGAPTRLEGSSAYTKTALVGFPSERSARDWYASPAYQELAAWRVGVMGREVDVQLVAGLPG